LSRGREVQTKNHITPPAPIMAPRQYIGPLRTTELGRPAALSAHPAWWPDAVGALPVQKPVMSLHRCVLLRFVGAAVAHLLKVKEMQKLC